MTAQTILPANTLSSGSYDVANSLRFDTASDDYLNRTVGTPTQSLKYTISAWVKRSVQSTNVNSAILGIGNSGSSNAALRFKTDDTLQFYDHVSNADQVNYITTRVFRDNSAWYHVVVSSDRSLGSPETKIFINGVQETSFGTSTEYNQNDGANWNTNGKVLYVGSYNASYDHIDGYLAEVVFADGQILAPDQFGEFDEDSGIWKPIKVSGLTFGNQGLYLEFKGSGTSANSSGLGADTSGNDHHFTVNNLTAVDQSTDTCTNNFCTINVLDNESGNITITEGNLNYTSTGGTDETNRGTFGFTKGKWYFESKFLDDNTYVDVGVGSASDSDIATPRFHMEMAGFYMLQIDSSSPGTRAFDNGSAGSGLGNSAVNDIHMFAIDMDNNKFYAGRNGTWYASGDPAGNANPLITMDDGYTTLMPSVCTKNDGAVSLNFGSPSYAISSGNADGNGFGNFEYAVPNGFFSLCTKNLAEHG